MKLGIAITEGVLYVDSFGLSWRGGEKAVGEQCSVLHVLLCSSEGQAEGGRNGLWKGGVVGNRRRRRCYCLGAVVPPMAAAKA